MGTGLRVILQRREFDHTSPPHPSPNMLSLFFLHTSESCRLVCLMRMFT